MPADKTGVPYLGSFAEVESTLIPAGSTLPLAVVHDAGTVMFPSGAEAQQIGAQVQAIGETLYEEVVYDDASGAADLRLDRLRDTDDVRHARCRARADRGVAGRRRVRGL